LTKFKNILKKYKRKKIFKLKYIVNVCLLQFLNSNESLFYILIKFIIHHLIKNDEKIIINITIKF